MANKKVSKAQATNKATGRLKKGYKATKSGYYQVVKAKAKAKSKSKPRAKKGMVAKAASKLTRAIKKMKL
jgi:hypothetical protein